MRVILNLSDAVTKNMMWLIPDGYAAYNAAPTALAYPPSAAVTIFTAVTSCCHLPHFYSINTFAHVNTKPCFACNANPVGG